MIMKHTLMALSLTTLFSANTVLAQDYMEQSIGGLPNDGVVNVSGMVVSIDGADSFTLLDGDSATITIESNSAAHIHKGDIVTVSGDVDTMLLGFNKVIEATHVTMIQKNMGATMAINMTPSMDSHGGATISEAALVTGTGNGVYSMNAPR